MGQYRLWLHHRVIDQELRGQQTTRQKELSEIDKHIARLEKIALPTNNTLINILIQQIEHQAYTTSKITDNTATQPEPNGAPQENANGLKYQTPPPSNYGQQGSDLQTVNPRPAPRPLHAYPGLLAWGHLPNFSTQDIYIPEEPSADPSPPLLAETDHLLPSDFHTLAEQKPQINERLPWWLRNLMQSSHEDQELQETTPIDQPNKYTNRRVEHWFARRTRLVHYDQ